MTIPIHETEIALDDAPRAGAPVTSQAVFLGDIEDSVTAVGTLQPLQFVDVGTQVSGQLKKIHVAFGEAVTQGQLLAEIDPTIYQARVNAGSAQLLNLKAQLAQRRAEQVLAAQQFKRQTELLAERATSQDAYEVAEAELQVKRMQIAALEAQIQQSESTLNADKANLGYTQIYAPMSGVVVDIIAKQGQTLNANQTAPIVLRIANLDTMTVYAQVSEADVNKLKTGMTAYFTTLGQPGRKRYGKLRQVIPTPQLVNNVVLYNALFDVENPDHDLFTQMTAQVFFVVAEAKQVPVVPVAALKQSRGGREGGAPARYSVRVKDGGKVVERPVEVGVMTRLNAEIKVGLDVGDEIMIDAPQVAPRPTQQGGNRGPRI
jgi:macrolide-specific efflux system membrane fusion protein